MIPRFWKYFLAAMFLATPAWGQSDDTHQCLTTFTGTLNDIDGAQTIQNWDFFSLTNEYRFDARTSTFYSQTVDPDDYTVNPDPFVNYPVDVRSSASDVCWAGGTHISNNPLDVTWHESKGGTDLPGRNSAGFLGYDTNVIVDGIRMHNQHDGLRPYWGGVTSNVSWEVRNIWVSYNRDDCIEVDDFGTGAPGLIEDSLFDGCYSFFSATWEDVTNVTFTIQNSLIRLQEMPGPYGWNDNTIIGHGELFKLRGTGPQFELHNNIFLIEDYSSTQFDYNGSAANSANELAFPSYTGCTGNIIVWVPPASDPDAPFPGNNTSDTNCVTITTDRKVWDAAVIEWRRNHPLVDRIAGVDYAAPTPSHHMLRRH